eukprot:8720995-Ditylum_brightwellii.AAC.1
MPLYLGGNRPKKEPFYLRSSLSTHHKKDEQQLVEYNKQKEDKLKASMDPMQQFMQTSSARSLPSTRADRDRDPNLPRHKQTEIANHCGA